MDHPAYPQIPAGPYPPTIIHATIDASFGNKPIADSTAAGSPFTTDVSLSALSGAVSNPAGTLQIDTTAPAVTSVVTSGLGIDGGGNGDLNAGHVVTLTVNMSEAVTVAGGTPTLSLNNGGTASYSGGTGTALTFSYTVGAGQDIGDLAVTSFNPNGATLQDAAGNNASLSGAVSNPAGTLQIDTTAPAVTSVVTSGLGIDGGGNGDLNAGHVVTLTVNLSEAVTVAGGTPTLSLNNGGTASYSGGTGTALTFSYTVGAGQDIGDLAVTSFNPNGATLQDAAGNNASLSGAVSNPAGTLQIDTTAPAVTSVVTSGSGHRRRRQRRSERRPCRHADGQHERGGDGRGRHADAVAEQWRHRELQRRHRDRVDLQLHGWRRAGHRRPGGDVVQPQRGDAAGCGGQQRQPLRRSDQPGRHAADRHHGAGGDLGRNLRLLASTAAATAI